MTFNQTTASNLAGPVTSSGKSAFRPNYRPSKEELEACLYNASIRAMTRKFRGSLKHSPIPESMFEVEYPSPPSSSTSTTSSTTPETPTTLPVPAPTAADKGLAWSTIGAPSPSTLPIPTFTPRASIAPATATAPSPSTLPMPDWSPAASPIPLPMSAFTPMFDWNACPPMPTRSSRLAGSPDPVLSPTDFYPGTFRRTPGAPASRPGSYFELCSEEATPAVLYGLGFHVEEEGTGVARAWPAAALN